MFADLALARRLEAAEGHAGAQFARCRRQVSPDSKAEAVKLGGANVVFDGVDSPITQTFGLGIFEDLREETLQEIESFFFERKSAVLHELCPLAGTAAMQLLCGRGYQPVEISSVLYRSVEQPVAAVQKRINARKIAPGEAALWADISTQGWSAEHPELTGFLSQMGKLVAAREDTICFLAEWDGQPGAAGSLSVHDGVALFGGASTIPSLRRRGLQAALLAERLRWSAEAGCDLAMMVAEAGSTSQRNAERQGFCIAYTRIKWRLPFELAG